jgi:SOS-response transcriptional repressor LexA
MFMGVYPYINTMFCPIVKSGTWIKILVHMNIGEKIRILRKQKGISPERLGMLCDISGQYIRKLESGHNYSITLETARKLAKGLDVPVSELIDHEELSVSEKPLKDILKQAQEAIQRMELISIPLRGSVPAGYPFPAEQESGEFVEVPRQELGGISPQSLYALKISGDSLQGDEIYSGDNVVVSKDAIDILDGKIYIVRLGNEVCARHVFKQDDHLRLVSSNGEYKELLATKVEILGRVILSGRWKKH